MRNALQLSLGLPSAVAKSAGAQIVQTTPETLGAL